MSEANFKIIIKKIVNLAREFQDKNILRYASGLSFYTIIGILPLLLLSLSLLSKIPVLSEHYAMIKELLFSTFLPIRHKLMAQHLDNFLQNSIGLDVINFITVVFASVTFFADYEHATSKVLKSDKKAKFVRTLGLYWMLTLLLPIMFGFSIYLSILAQNLLNLTEQNSSVSILKALSHLIIWGAFCIVFLITAGKNIKLKNALIDSFITASCWYAGKFALLYYAIYNKTYVGIYGSFAALLFFFLWIYVSWIVFLYGLKLCVILENGSTE